MSERYEKSQLDGWWFNFHIRCGAVPYAVAAVAVAAVGGRNGVFPRFFLHKLLEASLFLLALLDPPPRLPVHYGVGNGAEEAEDDEDAELPVEPNVARISKPDADGSVLADLDNGERLAGTIGVDAANEGDCLGLKGNDAHANNKA